MNNSNGSAPHMFKALALSMLCSSTALGAFFIGFA